MIEVDRLTKFYGARPAVRDVSFKVEKGEVVGFIGPNGAGKTTTMRILTCFLPPTSGTARICGFDVFDDPVEVRRRIGYMPENVSLYNEMITRSYLNFVSEMKGISKNKRREEVDKVITQCGLIEVANRYIGHLSKGYKQRVGLAQALLGDPEVLILDEPTVGLDPRQIIEIRELIRGLAGQHSVILSTHILPEVSMTCDRIIIVNEGRVAAEDTAENLTAKLQKARTLSMEVEGPKENVVKSLRTIPGVVSVACLRSTDSNHVIEVESDPETDVRKQLSQTVVQSGWGLLEMKPVGLSLEDIFVRLVTEDEEG